MLKDCRTGYAKRAEEILDSRSVVDLVLHQRHRLIRQVRWQLNRIRL